MPSNSAGSLAELVQVDRLFWSFIQSEVMMGGFGVAFWASSYLRLRASFWAKMRCDGYAGWTTHKVLTKCNKD